MVVVPFDNAPASRNLDLPRDPTQGGGSFDRWFDTGIDQAARAFTFGDSPRNGVLGPDLRNVDLSIQKDARLPGDRSLELRLEVLNLFNHPTSHFGVRLGG
jgi:hypothetical protein